MTTGEDQERAQRQIHSLVQRRVDGLIIVPSFDYQPLLAELEIYGIPVVLADRVEGKNPFPSVAVDNKQAGYIGGKHLFECGYRDIAFVNHGQRFWILNQRREGFAVAAREAGAMAECSFYDFSLDPEEIRHCDPRDPARSPAAARLLRREQHCRQGHRPGDPGRRAQDPPVTLRSWSWTTSRR